MVSSGTGVWHRRNIRRDADTIFGDTNMKLDKPFEINGLQHKYRPPSDGRKRYGVCTRLKSAAEYRTISQRGKSWLCYACQPVSAVSNTKHDDLSIISASQSAFYHTFGMIHLGFSIFHLSAVVAPHAPATLNRVHSRGMTTIPEIMYPNTAVRRSVYFVAAMVLSGCTMIPPYERPAAPVAGHYPGISGSTDTRTATDIAWRDFFTDRSLQQLITLALANNRDLRVAALNVEQSQAQYRISRSAAVPEIDGGGSYNRAHASGMTTVLWNANVGTTAYEVDFFGRVRSLNHQALEKYFATAEAQRSARISLVAQVANEYFSLRLAEAQLLLARQTLEAVKGSSSLNQATFDAGESNELDLRTAEGQVKTAEINVLTYERSIAQSHNALVTLVGCPLPDNQLAARPLDDHNLLVSIPAGLPSGLVQRRPDILEAEHTLKAANANIGVARTAFFPSITLTASSGSTSTELSKLFSSGTGSWSFSPQFSVPIFTGGRNLADLDAAKISTRIEVANYEKSIQTAFREVADALVAISSLTKEIEAQAALIRTQQQRYDLANFRYRQGEDSYLNVLSAQQDLYRAQQGRLAAMFSKLSNQISLYKALGGGWK